MVKSVQTDRLQVSKDNDWGKIHAFMVKSVFFHYMILMCFKIGCKIMHSIFFPLVWAPHATPVKMPSWVGFPCLNPPLKILVMDSVLIEEVV